MRINHNLAAFNTYRQLSSNSALGSKSLEKLSSGLRINRAGDDAAGLAISEKMRAQVRGLDQASRNAQDAISMIQTAEGALSETHSILQRMRELAVQGASDTNTSDDRKEIQKEINELVDEIDRISGTTEFNTKKLLDGSLAGNKSGASESASLSNVLQAGGINISGGLNITSAANSIKIVYDGKEVELNGLTTKSYDGSTAGAKIQDFAADLQRLIDENSDLAGHIQVSGVQVNADDATLQFTSDKQIEVRTASNNAVTLSSIGLSNGMKSFESQYEVSGVAMSYADVATGFNVSTGEYITIKYNGQDVNVTFGVAANTTFDGASASRGAAGIAENLQAQINADSTLKGHVAVVNDNGTLKFLSDDQITVSAGTTGNFASVGFASGTKASEVAPESTSSSTSGAGDAASIHIGANQGQTFSINISKMASDSLGEASAVQAAENTEDMGDHYNYSIRGANITAPVAITTAANSFVLKYGDEEYSVEGLETRTYTNTSDSDMAALAADIQDKINNVDELAGHVSVSLNAGNLVFTADKDFELNTSSSNGVTLSSAFGITAGSSAIEEKYVAQGTAITNLQADVSSDTSFTLKYDGTSTVALTLSHDPTYEGNVDDFVDNVQTAINANSTLKGHVYVALEDDKLTFYSDKALRFVSISGGVSATAAKIGMTDNQDATALSQSSSSVDADVGLLIKDLKVSNTSSGQGGVLTAADSEKAITAIDDAIKQVSAERSKLGAFQNRLEHTINNLGAASENLTAAESRIRDVDMAKEMMDFTKMNILSQAATAMLAQANQQPQGVLQLLR